MRPWEGTQGEQTWAPQAPREGPEADRGRGCAAQLCAGVRLCQLGGSYLFLVFSQVFLSFFLFFSQQRSSFEHFSCRPACPGPNVTARAPIQALLSCGLKSGEWGTELWVAVLGWGLSPHSPWQACLGLWSLSLFPVCSVTRSW